MDAGHLVTGLTAHADQVVRALQAGKHVACTVPMALTTGDLARIVAARRAAGTNYMMMETAVYTREFLWARDLAAAGALGRVSYARGTHFQDMTGWPPYWRGLPPMHYATHAVAPILALLGTRATAVRALGGGRGRSALRSACPPGRPVVGSGRRSRSGDQQRPATDSPGGAPRGSVWR